MRLGGLFNCEGHTDTFVHLGQAVSVHGVHTYCIKLFVCEADLETLMLFVSPSVAMLKIRMTG